MRGLRFDLFIAVCALLISTLATGASWWQARVLQAQTQVLQEQLGAQVWPYVGASEGINGDTVQVDIANEGLGPAVLRSVSATVDRVPKSNFIDIMHAILGPNLIARTPHGEKLSIAMDARSSGSVLRAGETIVAFSITSKRYARPFLRASGRLRSRICYCAIIPGKCWLSDSGSSSDPQPVPVCPEIPTDLLHASAVNELLDRKF
jgi:hypothetical protein